ncbi:hypothetical protein NC651_037918 [Populus alba x Populus x berolinensis]|nr:hypothetical protein NC651_037918 [Populus alba x Populus x berolinensis]
MEAGWIIKKKIVKKRARKNDSSSFESSQSLNEEVPKRDDEPGNASLESAGCVEDSKDVSCEGPGDVELTNPVSCINQIKQ